MRATEHHPNLTRSWRSVSTASLLICAGITAVAGNMSGSAGWGGCVPAALCLMVLALVFSIRAISRSATEVLADEPAPIDRRRPWMILAALILFHGLVAWQLCRALPANNIDCFTFQSDATGSLLQGVNPFGTTLANIYGPAESALFYGPGMVIDGRVQVGFPYPPLTLFWAIPGYLLGDVRYSYIAAVMIAAFLLFATAPNRRSLGLAAFLLLNPLTFFVEDRCWTEPLILMLLSATIYAAVKKRWWLPIALGLFIASKQYNFLALPFLGYLVLPFQWKPYLKLAGQSLAVAAATVLPFLYLNSGAIWHDLVLFHMAQPFRQDALSFAVSFPFLLKIGPLLLVAFIVWCNRVGIRNPAMFAAGYGISLLLFVSTSKQAFCNYYFLIAQALFLTAAALPGKPSRSIGEPAAESADATGDLYPDMESIASPLIV